MAPTRGLLFDGTFAYNKTEVVSTVCAACNQITGNSRERLMTRIDIGRLALVLCLSAAVLTACGRKGDLDLPGGANPVVKTIDGKKVEQVEDKPFILDPLL